MIKQKAPKDMTATEFVEGFIAFMNKRDTTIYDEENLRDYLSMPAPNPFTPDQLATMREYQRSGMNYVANNSGVALLFYKTKPYLEDNVWRPSEKFVMSKKPSLSFLGTSLGYNEVICFADYAPLEEK